MRLTSSRVFLKIKLVFLSLLVLWFAVWCRSSLYGQTASDARTEPHAKLIRKSEASTDFRVKQGPNALNLLLRTLNKVPSITVVSDSGEIFAVAVGGMNAEKIPYLAIQFVAKEVSKNEVDALAKHVIDKKYISRLAQSNPKLKSFAFVDTSATEFRTLQVKNPPRLPNVSQVPRSTELRGLSGIFCWDSRMWCLDSVCASCLNAACAWAKCMDQAGENGPSQCRNEYEKALAFCGGHAE